MMTVKFAGHDGSCHSVFSWRRIVRTLLDYVILALIGVSVALLTRSLKASDVASLTIATASVVLATLLVRPWRQHPTKYGRPRRDKPVLH
jgi:hypothetical protein